MINKWHVEYFMDLEIAFDTVDHTLLLNKLSYYGIRILQISASNLTKAITLCMFPAMVSIQSIN